MGSKVHRGAGAAASGTKRWAAALGGELRVFDGEREAFWRAVWDYTGVIDQGGHLADCPVGIVSVGYIKAPETSSPLNNAKSA